MLVPIESKLQIYVDFAARQRLQNTSARPKEKRKLKFKRHGVNVKDDNDCIHPPNVRLTYVGRYNFYLLRETIGRGNVPVKSKLQHPPGHTPGI